jgi:putative alpha-1,2-mannosidase
MKKIVSLILPFLLFFNICAQEKDYARFVDPFVGTGGHGHTFPGATVPFGMVQLSPDTRIDNWDGSSGYHYSDSTIFGFSHTHLSGTGVPDYCDILVTPRLDKNNSNTFSHKNETASAGFYSVKMDNGILAELTATTRVGLHRYTFPEAKYVNLDFNLKWRDKVLDSSVKIAGKNRIEGFRRSSSWAKDQVVYFVAEFSEPIVGSAITNDSDITERSERIKELKGTGLIAHLRFENPKSRKILVKVAISPVSIEGARKNLEAELPHWDFEKVKSDARAAWNKELSKIEIAGGTEAERTNFYTALYHTMIAPNVFSDVDGNYPGLDKKIHNINEGRNPRVSKGGKKSPAADSALSDARASDNYTIFSLWDTFRAVHPLYTIIDEERTVDFINTFIRQYEQGGRLPVWELAGNETDTMIGYHAVSVIADAMAKDIKGFDYEKAFEAAKHSAELDHFGLEAYKRRGYISMEDEQESVSKTLEYAYNDFCIAQMAKILGKSEDYAKYLRRAQYYKNLFDRETGFMRPKQNGNWVAPFAPNEVTFHFTEGNSWVYTFFVPHDVSGLIELYGGRENFARKLEELFTTEQKLTGREQPDITGLIGQYAHGNEPSHHIAYLFNYAGEPWKTQMYVRKILDEFYKPTPDGLIGNEDCGQMSAWYVLSAMGFYPVAPSIPVYDLGAPLFREAKINLENGRSFTVRAANVSEKNRYVKSVKLNGKPLRRTFFRHEELMSGGVLEFEMSETPVKDWFDEFSASKIDEDFAVVPTIEAARSFENETEVKISTAVENSRIFYTLDGSGPDEKTSLEYKGPFRVGRSVTVKAVSVNSGGEKSFTAEARLDKMPNDWDVKLFSTYNRQYTGGGPKGLIDGIRGTLNFASGGWQGYQGQDFVAVIDLKKETEIKKLGGGFLQDARPWIWMPTRIEFEVSADGREFQRVAEIKTTVAPEDMRPQIKDYFAEIAPVKARFVRVKAVNLGKIPQWHPGAGEDAFIFVDEIFIE